MVVEKAEGNELRFKNPEQLLVVVVGFVFWGVGFLDLLGHTSADATVFGLYSLPFFVFIILYGVTGLFWIALFVSPPFMARVLTVVGKIQSNKWLVAITFIGLAGALWLIVEWDRWARLPGLQFSAFALTILAIAVLLFSGWREHSSDQRWRKIIAYPLLALVIIEIFVQLLAYFSVLPGTYTIGGDFAPYEKIYYNEEGFRNGYANRYGWTSAHSELNDENKRILFIGGSQVQALQLPAEQQMNTRLEDLINAETAEDAQQSEIVPIGLAGFGLSPFLYELLFVELPTIIDFDEVVVFWHLGNDFQAPSPTSDALIYAIKENGKADVLPEQAQLRHDLGHYYTRGFTSFQPVETIRGNYLTPRVLAALFSGEKQDQASPFDIARQQGFVNDRYTLTEPGSPGIRGTDVAIIPDGNNFMFMQDGSEVIDEAITIAGSMLEISQKVLSEQGITLRIVTLPVFPQAFYDEFAGNEWQAEIGDYDLLLPEKALIDLATDNDISILPMGQYLMADGLSAEKIQSLFYQNGLGHLTPEGHAYFAQAIYNCFYAPTGNDACFNAPGE